MGILWIEPQWNNWIHWAKMTNNHETKPKNGTNYEGIENGCLINWIKMVIDAWIKQT